jgi:hypothetical protein
MLIKFRNVKYGSNYGLCSCQAKLQREPTNGSYLIPGCMNLAVSRFTNPLLLLLARRNHSMLKVQSKLLRRIWMGVARRHRRRRLNQRFMERDELSPMLCHIGRAPQQVSTSLHTAKRAGRLIQQTQNNVYWIPLCFMATGSVMRPSQRPRSLSHELSSLARTLGSWV